MYTRALARVLYDMAVYFKLLTFGGPTDGRLIMSHMQANPAAHMQANPTGCRAWHGGGVCGDWLRVQWRRLDPLLEYIEYTSRMPRHLHASYGEVLFTGVRSSHASQDVVYPRSVRIAGSPIQVSPLI